MFPDGKFDENKLTLVLQPVGNSQFHLYDEIGLPNTEIKEGELALELKVCYHNYLDGFLPEN
jgi:hypothetical protein